MFIVCIENDLEWIRVKERCGNYSYMQLCAGVATLNLRVIRLSLIWKNLCR